MVAQSAAAFLAVRQGGKTFVMTFGYAAQELRTKSSPLFATALPVSH
jgi:hypothetical protein